MMKYGQWVTQISFLFLIMINDSFAKVEHSKEERTSHQSFHKKKTVLDEAVFNESLQNALPLSPEQIIKLRKHFNQTQAAMAAYPTVPPKLGTTILSVDLSPGSIPIVVRLAKRYVTSLEFTDAMGQPWPIKSYIIGDPEGFNVQWDKESHLLMVQANKLYDDGSLTVVLKNSNKPITLTLLAGQQTADSSLELRVPGEGPNPTQYIGRSVPEHVSSDLLDVLHGIPPQGSKSLRVIGGDGKTQAWLGEKCLYLRTPLMVCSPAWTSMTVSTDKTYAYELPRVPFILALYKGKQVQLKIEGL